MTRATEAAEWPRREDDELLHVDRGHRLVGFWRPAPGPKAEGAAVVRRRWRRLDPNEGTPRELRHSFVSLLSDVGVPLENISRLVGHSGSAVTELVYRKQIRPVIAEGAQAMDRIFALPSDPETYTGA